MKNILTFAAFILFAHKGFAQSPDARVCYCWSSPVSNDHMLGTSAVYGRIGVKLSRGIELKPNNGQPVQFNIPALPARSNCRNVYSILIYDESDKSTVLETESASPSLGYTFSGCGKTFSVTLKTASRSVSGSAGNCSRSITFQVKPQCR